jgi:small conductance mechanosensitive channel
MLFLCRGVLFAGEGSYTAITTEDPDIPTSELELLLRPLRVSELEVEAEAWFMLLQEKVRQISAAEIEMKRKGREISETKAEVKEQIKEIKEVNKVEEKAAGARPEANELVEKVADANVEIEQKIEEIDQKTEEIAEAAEDITKEVVTEIAEEEKKEVRASEKDLLEKTEEVEEAKEELKEVAEMVSGDEMNLEDKVKAIGEAEVKLHAKVKEQLIAGINKLREERVALTDRFRTVIDALAEKGGETNEYEKYITAISGLKVDVKDVSATKALIFGWLKSPEGGLRWGKAIASFVTIIVAFKILSIVVSGLVRKALSMNKKCGDLLRAFFVNIVRKSIFVIGLIVALSMLGVNIGPLVAGIGAIGFIVGFALQGTLGNFAAGLMILMHRPYDVGDIVETAGVTGFVQSMNLNTTTIKTFDNQVVVVPNGSIWGDNIVNVTGSDTRRVDMTFGIGYKDDIAKAQRIMEDILKSHPLVLDDPEPNVKVHELGDSSVNFVCRPWTETRNYWTVYWDITRSVKERFDAEGVSIPFPQRDVHLLNASPPVTAQKHFGFGMLNRGVHQDTRQD